MDSHSSKNKMASLIFASRNINLKFSPADMVPREGKLMSRTWLQRKFDLLPQSRNQNKYKK